MRPSLPRFLLVFPVLILPLRHLAAQEATLPLVPPPVREAMQRGDYAAAVRELEALESALPDSADFWLYLRGLAQFQLGDGEGALELLARVERDYPASVWRDKAYFQRAEILRGLRRYGEAEALFEAGAIRLRSTGRQRELASFYFQFADALSGVTPPAGLLEAKPDYQRAYGLYEKATQMDGPAEVQEYALYRMAACLQELRQWNQAVPLYERYGREHPTGPRVAEAALNLGICRMEGGDPKSAARGFEDLVAGLDAARSGAGAWAEIWQQAGEARRGLLAATQGEGAFLLAHAWQRQNQLDLAIAALRRFLERFPEHGRRSEAAFAVAEHLWNQGRDADCLQALEDFRAQPPPSGVAEQTREEDARLRMRAVYRKGEVLLRQKRFEEAIASFTEYAGRFPNGPDWAAAQKNVIEAEYAIGHEHREAREYAAARTAWGKFLDLHPLDERARQIQFDLGQLYAEEAENLAAAEQRRPELFRTAIAEWRRLVEKYPGTEEASRALYASGQTYEVRLLEMEPAIRAYRECSFGSHAGRAAERLVIMTRPELLLQTERTWRSDEQPRVKVQTRNLEKLQVQLHRLDIAAYFRKHYTHRSVEALDLDLIAADQDFEVPVPGYQPYQPIEQEVDLPVSGAGVWAVAVTGDKLRATTLVLCSDVEIIVKASRRELFVFAQDVRAQQPAAGVQVLAGVPGSRIWEARTGDDGVARLRFPELESAAETRVLAQRDGHCAAEGLSLGGLQLGQGLTARGYVYTDRPAFRPGQTVHWKAILREVQDGAYAYAEGQECQVDVFDSQGRRLHHARLPLNAFGALSGAFELPLQAAPGQYQIRTQTPAGTVAQGTFTVHHYELQKIDLDFELPREVYYRGERVELEAVARYYYGEPLGGALVQFTAPDGRLSEARTDRDGRAKFGFETRDSVDWGATVEFQATLPAEQVSASGTVYLALQEYSASLSTSREVYLVEEGFEARLQTRGPSGAPVGREMKLQVLRRESRGRGQWAEVLLEERSVATDAQSGTALVPLRLESGGPLLLRAYGVDRFQNPVIAERPLYISGDQDETRLRLLADVQRVKVGERLSFDLYNRAGAGLALLTFEGEEILGYRVVSLQPGSNPLALEVEHAHFPNFSVSAAFMQGNRFYEASSQFRVERELRVVLATDQERYAPGETATVSLLATDQLGRPVQAELSLAVVDAALLDLYPDPMPHLRAFFEEGALRVGQFRTATSCTFRYQGTTVEISQALLEEAARRLAEQQWEVRRAEALDALTAAAGAPLTLRAQAAVASAPQEAEAADLLALGGGAGGKFSGRGGRGGRRGGVSGPSDGIAEVARPEPDRETAFWAPAVLTGADGRAVLSFSVPRHSSQWTLTCRGVGPDTLLDQQSVSIVARAEFFVELRAPLLLTEGDQARFAVRVHNRTGLQGRAELQLQLESSEGARSFPGAIELGADPVVEYSFPAWQVPAGASAVTVAAAAAGHFGQTSFQDRASRELPVQPWGLTLVQGRSGVLSAGETFWLELDDAGAARRRVLELQLGLDAGQMLVDEALGREIPPWSSAGCVLPYSQADAAHDLIGVCAVLELLHRSSAPRNPRYQELWARGSSLVAELVAGQGGEGGWHWVLGARGAQAEVSSRAMAALGIAQRLGYPVPPETLTAGAAYLQRAFRDASQQADEIKAMLLYALAVHEQGDFGAANRLHRARGSLSPAALAYTALALAEMERGPMAAEVAASLEEKMESNGVWPTAGNLGWNRGPLEMSALALVALEQAAPAAAAIGPGVEALLAARPWHPQRARGLAVAAVATYQSRVAPAQEESVVAVRLDGGDRQYVVQLDAEQPSMLLSLPVADEVPRRLKVELSVQGGGRPHYAAELRGFTSEVEPRKTELFQITRQAYLAAPPRYQGRELRSGFQTLRQQRRQQWNNQASEQPLGELRRDRVEFYRDFDQAEAVENLDYLVLEVPLPAGARVVEGSVGGGFQSFEVQDGRIVAFYGQHRGSGWLEYSLVGATAGEFRVLPASLSSAFEPRLVAVGEARSWRVLERGATTGDSYRPTPDELYDRGKAAYQNADAATAFSSLERLFEEHQEVLRDEVLRDAAGMLLFLSIDRGEAHNVVRYFELLREKDPELTIPFDKVLIVGGAYRELGEHERALLIFRAVIEETFGKDLKVAAALEEQGESSAALAALRRFWLEFPDLPAVVETSLALSDKLLLAAPKAHEDPSLRRAGRDRAALTLESIALLQAFLAMYPEDPQAPDAGLNLVSAYLALEDYPTAAGLAGFMSSVYQEPKYADAFLHTQAVAEWYLGRDERALELLQRIAAAEYQNPDGTTRPSDNRDFAWYILGQIHHARQDVARASEYYQRIETLFADAREALAGFREQQLVLPEVTTARPGAAPELEIRSRNLDEAELLVYAVDLMTLYLRERNLSSVTAVNLAGIAPALRQQVSLPGGSAIRPHAQTVSLNLSEPGAYLVIARGGDLHASGLVLLTELELQVKEEPFAGQLRVEVLDQQSGRYLRDVDVRVVGSGGGALVSGRTDPRGLFVAENVQGVATVIARRDQRHYAFHRGSVPLGAQFAEQLQEFGYTGEAGGDAAPVDKDVYLKNVMLLNDANQQQRAFRYQEEVQRARAGVQVKQVR